MDEFNLNRFIEAQSSSYEAAMLELSLGKKTGHWMWYIFPQIDGLGSTDMTKLYSIKSLKEASAYLGHPILGQRLIESCEILLNFDAPSISNVMGFPDDLKLRSSMTLFEYISKPDSIFKKVLTQYFDDNFDDASLEILKKLS
tara:strand:+ start:22 stop:450 length:429 start_codon:yes stop_codon:yes gene_type:complete